MSTTTLPWYSHIPLHATTNETIINFLRETSPTPVYGSSEYKFRYIGTHADAKKLCNKLRVALSRVRKKAQERGVATTPFVMIINPPETHTINDETFHIITLQRKAGSSNPFIATAELLSPEVLLAIGNRDHPPTKMIMEMLQSLTKHELRINMHNWQQVTSVMWLVAHDYVKLDHICPKGNGVFTPITKPNHVNPNSTA